MVDQQKTNQKKRKQRTSNQGNATHRNASQALTTKSPRWEE